MIKIGAMGVVLVFGGLSVGCGHFRVVKDRYQQTKSVAIAQFVGEPAKDLAKSLKQNRGYDIIVLDGAPGTPKRTAELVPACDLIVLPTGASRAYLVPTLALARRIAEMKHNGVGPIFALCRVMTESEAATAREAIAAAGFEVFDGELIERPGYRQAQNIGRSPT